MNKDHDLWYRKDFLFRNEKVNFTGHQEQTFVVVDPHTQAEYSRKVVIGWIVSVRRGYKHAFFMTDILDFDIRELLSQGFFSSELEKFEKGISIISGHENPIFDDQRSMADCVFTRTIYIFTRKTIYEREIIRNLFKSYHMNAILIDDQRWLAEYDALQPDAFICHDSRDKAKYALPLYQEMRSRKLKIWYDQFSIRPGHDIVEAIERGILQCNNAIILVTDNFLGNDRWASQELRTLINMSFSTTTGKHIIPVWIGVTSERVMSKSPFLAKISAVTAKKYHFSKKISEITNEICRGMK